MSVMRVMLSYQQHASDAFKAIYAAAEHINLSESTGTITVMLTDHRKLKLLGKNNAQNNEVFSKIQLMRMTSKEKRERKNSNKKQRWM
jgi:hypothetical protein